MIIRLERLTTAQVAELFKNSGKKLGLILPVGCLEQHGPYLPLGCDTDIARKASETLALRLQEDGFYRAFVMPDFTYTPSPGAENTTGTVSVSFEFLGKGLSEVISAAIKTPWDFIAMVNTHAHNQGRVIETSIAGARGSYGRTLPIVVINIYEFSHIADKAGLNSGSHAGEFEIALHHYYSSDYAFPEATVSEKVLKERPPNIFGLDIMKRSYAGILSDGAPDLKRALEKSEYVGKKVDEAIFETFINNLNSYFKYWK